MLPVCLTVVYMNLHEPVRLTFPATSPPEVFGTRAVSLHGAASVVTEPVARLCARRVAKARPSTAP